MQTKEDHIVKKQFSEKELFTKKELGDVLQSYGLAKNDNALRQIIYTLKKKGIIQSPKRGIYTTHTKAFYKPSLNNYLLKIRRLFTSRYPEINYCVWSSAYLHEFMVHQPFSSFYLLETEVDMLETVFNLFNDNNIKAFISLDSSLIQNYVSQTQKPLIVEKLPVRSPVIKQGSNVLPSLEKMLVDVFTEKTLFYYYQGNELENIFRYATQNYYINFSGLFSYAAVRGQKQKIIAFLKEKTNINLLVLQ